MLSRAPLIRILIPLILGIIVSEHLDMSPIVAVAAIAILAAIYIIAEHFTHHSPARAMRYGFIPAVAVYAMCGATGALSGAIGRTPDFNASAMNGKMIYCQVTDIRMHENSTELLATIRGGEHINNSDIAGHKIQLYLNHINLSITEGDVIMFRSALSPIRNLGNPEEFDYGEYMLHRGYRYTQSILGTTYRTIGHTTDVHSLAKHSQRSLVNRVLNSNLSPHTKRLVNTAILGDASFIDPDTRADFSKAGIAHILAISGLHIGIILAIITFLLRPLDYLHIRHLRIVLSVIAVPAFLFVTGASPSAIRAAIMAIFVMVALLTHRQNSSLNSLCAAAIVILTFSPMAIHDVGFQLSFTAVLMIILLFSPLNPISPRSRVKYYIISAVLTVLLANMGCAALSAYYFHSLPLFSLCSNFLVVPLLPLFIGLGLVYIALLTAGIHFVEMDMALDWLCSFFTSVADVAATIPFSHIENVYVSPLSLTLYLALLGLIVALVYYRRFSLLIASMATCALVIASTTIGGDTPRGGMVIFNGSASTPIVLFSRGDTAQLWCPDDFADTKKFARSNPGFIARYGIDKIEPFSDSCVAIVPPFAAIGGKRIAVINATRWKYFTARRPLHIDYMIITKRYYGNISDLLDTFSPRTIVISGGIYPDRQAEYIEECRAHGIHCHNLSTDGTITIAQ